MRALHAIEFVLLTGITISHIVGKAERLQLWVFCIFTTNHCALICTNVNCLLRIAQILCVPAGRNLNEYPVKQKIPMNRDFLFSGR